ncbi:GlpG protein [Allopseudospirillum japonicum]|uniref:GlpG protein n=1 Tax=Allopseudospirillum japonicum TaxID=64971 RepID=A0A1H6RFJ4_9GAMM|nr:rhomboid family intramembrane serine protease [Allopseudospirillum japonicum]SEI54598.1 GlpG protein [Allopseudospirillum japonicum]
MLKVLVASANIDLKPLSDRLWAQQIEHKILKDALGEQVIFLMHAQDVQRTQPLIQRWQAEQDTRAWTAAVTDRSQARPTDPAASIDWRKIPVVWLFVLPSLLASFLVLRGFEAWIMPQLSLVPVWIEGGQVYWASLETTFMQGEIWRLLTPIFLHFSWMHLVFNMLWLVYLGRSIEHLRGHGALLNLVLITGVGANLGQFLWDASPLFGGMSGVVYGLLGYILAWTVFDRQSHFGVPRGLVVFMLAWLLLAMTPITTWLGWQIANAAHVVGLLLGVLVGVFSVWKARLLKSC